MAGRQRANPLGWLVHLLFPLFPSCPPPQVSRTTLFSAVLRALPARVQQSTDPPDPIGVVQAAVMEKGALEALPSCARCGKPAQLQCVFLSSR